jgi:2-polyprenyl-3-methyl-5-hydroxy-6-metoxy-1,4-benzoquinol methylase
MSPRRGKASRSETTDSVAYFDAIAGSYESWTASNLKFRERLRCFSALIQKYRESAPTSLALDLGCGNGELTRLTSRAGFQVVGFDGSGKMLRRARAAVSTSAPDVSFREERLPLRREIVSEFRARAGLIVASSVIEYLEDDGLFLSQCHEMLAPGGRALVSFANAASARRRVERVLGARGPLRGTIVEVQRHSHDIEQVRRLAAASRLSIDDITYFGFVFPDLAARVLGKEPAWLAPLMLVCLRRQ